MIYKSLINSKVFCHHCGDECFDSDIADREHFFCCNGCKSVFEILNQHEMCSYYDMNLTPGIKQKLPFRKDKFAFLDNEEIKSKLINFTDEKFTHVIFYLPQIHCSSCIWLLENVDKFNAGIISSSVNFVKKEIFIQFENNTTSLRNIVETLANIGYEPYLSLIDMSEKQTHFEDRSRWYKLGVAGFCFANIMMISLAEYLVDYNHIEANIRQYFLYLTFVLSLPIIFYCASEFFVSAWQSLIKGYLNIDLPVSLSLVITFCRSLYEIFAYNSFGYLDSLAGIVFFMLIGRWLQSRTYNAISFDRDYKSFLPIALDVIENGKLIQKKVTDVKINDLVHIHSNEIIPVDCLLSKGVARIDYSFVNGEVDQKEISKGELIYAGGKQKAGLIEVLVMKELSQSYLTSLWNNPIFDKKETPTKNVYDVISSYFTYIVLIIGGLAGIYWYYQDSFSTMWNAITTVLIVACPCALLLSKDFTYGNILQIFSKNKLYLKSINVIERFNRISHIVFDKTGTITKNEGAEVQYIGQPLDSETTLMIASLTAQSNHPFSQNIYEYLNIEKTYEVQNFLEVAGNGIEAWINEQHIKIGSAAFVNRQYSNTENHSKVVIKIDNQIIGEFMLANLYREGIKEQIAKLNTDFQISLISGDNDGERATIKSIFGNESEVEFNMSPLDKLNYVSNYQSTRKGRVMMIGDGLNDAGALKQSDIGICVSNSVNTFFPASDGVLDSSQLNRLSDFISLGKGGKGIILLTFGLSALYNIIGLFFAVQGSLSPLIAAILMPASSITIVLITYFLTNAYARYLDLKI